MKKIEINNLTPSQKKVYEAFQAGHNIFITGHGGAGKSFLTRFIIQECEKQKRNLMVCAPTGIAAINIGGTTIHRALRIPVGLIDPNCKIERKNTKLLAHTDVLIIDEISMCRIDLFTFVARCVLSIGHKVQLLVVGDFFQLPPVITKDEEPVLRSFYGDKRWAFQSPLWTQLNIWTMELKESMRQTDKAFISALDAIRRGKPKFRVFSDCFWRQFDPMAVELCPLNKLVDHINSQQLQKLIYGGAVAHTYEGEREGDVKDSEIKAPESLELCVGAKVIILANDPKEEPNYVNGDMGTVIDLFDNSVGVQLERGNVIEVTPYTWPVYCYEIEYEGGSGKKLVRTEIGHYTQIPLNLAWAITIHKSQGQTYDRCNINPEGIFGEGQLYVALSRCRTLEGLHISALGKTLGEHTRYLRNFLFYAEEVKGFMSKTNSKIEDLSNSKCCTARNPKGAGRKSSGRKDIRTRTARVTDSEILMLRVYRGELKCENLDSETLRTARKAFSISEG